MRRFMCTVAFAAILFTSLLAQTPQPSPTQPTPQQQQKSQPKCTDVDAALSALLRNTIPLSLLDLSRSRHVPQESTACRNHTIVFFLIVGV